MAELIIQPHNKAGGRSVSISEERQFGVSAIYRSGYRVRHWSFYRSVSISKKETVWGLCNSIYRSGYICHLYKYSIQGVSLHHEKRRLWVSALYSSGYTPCIHSKHRSISIREERQFEVSTTYRSGYTAGYLYRSVSISEERPQSNNWYIGQHFAYVGGVHSGARRC